MSHAVARLVVRLRWLVVAGWLAAAVAATLYLPNLEDAEGVPLSSLVPEDSDSVAAGRRSARVFEYPVLAHTAIVQRDPDGLSAEVQARLAQRALDLRDGEASAKGAIAFALPLANTLELVPGSEESSTTAITFLFFGPDTSIGEETEAAHRFVDERYGAEDEVVGVTGAVPARLAEWDAIASALPWVTLATVAAILVVLALN
jgi:putative drug exporter of the RND superfamily